jgi:hypothetical protein
MRIDRIGRAPTVSLWGALLLLLPLTALAVPAQQMSSSGQEGQSSSAASNPAGAPTQRSAPIASPQLPDSPGTMYAANLIQNGQSTPQQLTQQDQQNTQNTTQVPAGTAAARAASPAGVAASEPAGSAIAPAKQRRVRTLLISVAAVVGAGAALGAVAALSAGSPSRPPGTH